jgi:hypothetical protein
MERFGVLARHSELGILVHKALCTLLKPFDRFLIPPVGIVSGFIIVSSSRVECYKSVRSNLAFYPLSHDTYRVKAHAR